MRKGRCIAASAAALLILASCQGYRVVSFDRKLSPGNPALFRDRAPAANERAEAPGAKTAATRFTVFRSFALMRSPSPAAAINNRAVGLSSRARYGEAEILFRESLAEEKSAAAYNNLGIVCELRGLRDEAFRLYTTACLMEPGNTLFRSNFQSFADFRGGRGVIVP